MSKQRYLSITPAPVPENPRRSRSSIYREALERFERLGLESARIDSDDMRANSIAAGLNQIIRRTELYPNIRVVTREGQAYLVRMEDAEQ